MIDNWEETRNSQPPSKQTISSLVTKFEKPGNVADAPRQCAAKSVRSLENQDIVAAAFVHSPRKSQRRASDEHGISRTSLQRIMSDIGLIPFRPV